MLVGPVVLNSDDDEHRQVCRAVGIDLAQARHTTTLAEVLREGIAAEPRSPGVATRVLGWAHDRYPEVYASRKYPLPDGYTCAAESIQRAKNENYSELIAKLAARNEALISYVPAPSALDRCCKVWPVLCRHPDPLLPFATDEASRTITALGLRWPATLMEVVHAGMTGTPAQASAVEGFLNSYYRLWYSASTCEQMLMMLGVDTQRQIHERWWWRICVSHYGPAAAAKSRDRRFRLRLPDVMDSVTTVGATL